MRPASENVGCGAIVGRRTSQQDTFLTERLARDGSILAIVADGMGGHAEGAMASELAATVFRDAFVLGHGRGKALRETFMAALEAANRAVAEAQRGHPERNGMGTTLLAAHLSATGLAWVSVGDSPLLVEAGGALRRLNEDHSLRSVENRGRASANMLRSAVAGSEIALIDAHPDPVRLGAEDRVLLASDGLLALSMDRIARVLTSSRKVPAQAVADRLLALVEEAGASNQDNCTVIVLSSLQSADTAAVAANPIRPIAFAALGLVALVVVVLALVW